MDTSPRREFAIIYQARSGDRNVIEVGSIEAVERQLAALNRRARESARVYRAATLPTGHTEANTNSHWHVATGLTGYGPDAVDDTTTTAHAIQSLAHAVAEECKRTADFEYESADGLAESGDYKSAWFTMKNGDDLIALAANFDYAKRLNAPLYRDDPKGREALDESMLRLVEESFPHNFRDGNSRLYVWTCTEPECSNDEEEASL